MGPSMAWFYEGQLRLHQNWNWNRLFSYAYTMVSLGWGNAEGGVCPGASTGEGAFSSEFSTETSV